MKHLRRAFSLFRGFFPSKLPIGSTSFEIFADSIIKTYGLPDKTSYRHAIATMIMHLPPQQIRVRKRYFAKSILKAMVNEVAYQKIQDYKDYEKQKKDTTAKVVNEPTG